MSFTEIQSGRKILFEWIYKTPPYRLCQTLYLPKGFKRFCARRADDIIEYGAEFIGVWVVLLALMKVSSYNGSDARRHKSSIFDDFKTLVSRPGFEDDMAKIFPRLYSWYGFFKVEWMVAKWRIKRVVDGARWLFGFSSLQIVRALFAPSPVHAAMVYQSRHNDPFSSKIRHCHVRFHFFSSLEKGKFQHRVYPDISIDLEVKKEGIDLSYLRKKLGVETLAVIANVDPFRIIFNPANEDHLSVLAAYDLSQQFTAPIKVYEPHVSKAISTARKIHDYFYPVVYGLYSFIKLVFGFPEELAYIKILYGTEYAKRYESVGLFTRPIKQWSLYAFNSILFLITKAPFIICFSVARLILLSIVSTVAAVIFSVRALTRTVTTITTFLLSMQSRQWIFALASIWWALAEFNSLRV